MPTLLHLDASALQETSISRALSAEFVRAWCDCRQVRTVIRHDLAGAAIPPIDHEWIAAAFTPAEARTDAQKKTLRLSDDLVQELKQADEIVIGTPMYNFAPPASLKLWIDQIVRLGETYKYVEGKRQGCLPDKCVYLLLAAGGTYEAGSSTSAYDFVSSYLRVILGYMGIQNIKVHWAGGTQALLKPGSDRTAFLRSHLEQIRNLAATTPVDTAE